MEYIYSGTSNQDTIKSDQSVSCKERGVLISEVVKYTNVLFGTDKSVLGVLNNSGVYL